MQFTQRQRLSSGRWRLAATAIAVGLLLGFAGPFGSNPAYPTATRYAFWLGLTLAGALAAVAADILLPDFRRRARPVRIGAAALVSALPMTFVVAWTMSFIQPGRHFTPQQLAALFFAVAAVQLLIVTAIAAAQPKNAEAFDAAPAFTEPEVATPAFPAALLSRLPAEVRNGILALETEDHYLRVHAAGGSALILMRMADVVALLDPRLGAQVHRRWWVADAAVERIQTDGQKVTLRLTDDRVVPVGRTFAAAARARFGTRPGKPVRGKFASSS